MGYFVIMNVGTERLYRRPNGASVFSNERGAKISCTKLNKLYQGNALDVTDPQWVIMSYKEFNDLHNPLVAVYNNITGDGKTPIYIRKSEVGGCTDPSTERYHCM